MEKNHQLLARVQRLAAEAAALKARGLVRYPAATRSKIINCLEVMRSESWTWGRCAEAMGICKSTLHAWHKNGAEREAEAKHAMIAVKVREISRPVPSSGVLTIHLPQGVTVAGMTILQVAELARLLD